MGSNNLYEKYPGAQTFTFGDSEALCGELLALVRAGTKRATFSALADVAAGREAMPVVGRRDIALNWDGTPALVCETWVLKEIRFCDVTEEMALSEGEDEPLESWQRGHQAYYTRAEIFDPEMVLIYEQFDVIADLAQS
jgi:uncharacterized protein YhfF